MTVPSRIPWLTIALLAINLTLAVMVTVGGGQLVEQFGFRADTPTLASAFVAMFLHWNLLHLLGNMLFLAAAGSAVEQAVGPLKLGVIYLVGGLTGTLLHWAAFRNADGVAPMIGASGCIAACVGFAAVRYGRQKIELHKHWGVPLWALAGVWVALQTAGFFVRLGDASGGTAFAAHIGGLGFGLLMSLALKATNSSDEDAAVQKFRTLTSEGPRATLAAAEEVLKLKPSDPIALSAAAEAARQLGDTSVELPLRMRQLELEPEAALTRLEELNQLAKIPEMQRLKLCSRVSEPAKLKLLRSVALDERSPERPNALLELALIQPDAGWSRTLRADYPMHPATEIARTRGLF